MGDRIKISLAECARVADLLEDHWDDNRVAAVMAVITAYNQFVSADPVGTIRRNPRDGSVAIRAVWPCNLIDCRGLQPYPSWHYFTADGERHHCRDDSALTARDIATWPVIFQPGGGADA